MGRAWGAWALPPCSSGDARTQHGLSPHKARRCLLLAGTALIQSLAMALSASEQEAGLERCVGSGSTDCIRRLGPCRKGTPRGDLEAPFPRRALPRAAKHSSHQATVSLLPEELIKTGG